MPLIDIKADPSRKDLAVFALLWAVFFLVFGRLAGTGGTGLLYAAAATGAALAVSLAFNAEQPRRRQLAGAAFPLGLLGAWAGARAALGAGLDGPTTRAVFTAIGGLVGVAGGALVLASPSTGRALYRGWMLAALPIGWTFSMGVLAIAFYGVITPVGVAMRLVGRDPLHRRFDRAAGTYWSPRRPARDPSRYFRQS